MVCGGYVQVGGTVRFRLRVPVKQIESNPQALQNTVVSISEVKISIEN